MHSADEGIDCFCVLNLVLSSHKAEAYGEAGSKRCYSHEVQQRHVVAIHAVHGVNQQHLWIGSCKLDCSIICEEEFVDMARTVSSVVTGPGVLFKLCNKRLNGCEVAESITLILEALIVDFLKGYKHLGV